MSMMMMMVELCVMGQCRISFDNVCSRGIFCWMSRPNVIIHCSAVCSSHAIA